MQDTSGKDSGKPTPLQAGGRKVKSLGRVIWHHATTHVGPGLVSSVAYFDPGNWGVDLQAGSQFGYKLLFIVLLAGIFACFFQSLASKLGCVTGRDLATNCRLALYNRPKHTKLWRWLTLYPLYALAEIAIISTDLAELLGSAIALTMLFPSLPLWAGVLLTSCDVLLILVVGDPLRGKPVKAFEWLISGLVLAVFVSLAIIMSKINVNWGQAVEGYLPSATVFQSGALYTSIGVIGATVMPHSLFLGSFLATQDRESGDDIEDEKTMSHSREQSFDSLGSSSSSKSVQKRMLDYCIKTVKAQPVIDENGPKSHADATNNPMSFVAGHLWHGIIDICVSLLGFAVLINSFILVLASAVFFYGTGSNGSLNPASLFDAQELISQLVGKPAAILFAIALLAAGQSSSIIATVAGQIVAEGFIQWKVSPVLRRLVTRGLGLIPSMAIAIIVGRPGLNALLVGSQVVLSIVLPFIVFPLMWFTSSPALMGVDKPQTATMRSAMSSSESFTSTVDIEAGVEKISFANNKPTAAFGYFVWLIILVANGYVIVSLALGQDS